MKAWMLLIRAVNADVGRESLDKEFDWAKQYLTYITEHGCAKPIPKKEIIRHSLIPRDIEKDIKTRVGKPVFNIRQLTDIR